MPEFDKKQWFYILFMYWHFCVCAHFNSLLFSFNYGDSFCHFVSYSLSLYDLNLIFKGISKSIRQI